MNWSQGLLRAWMVFTVAWLIGVGVNTSNHWPEPQEKHGYLSDDEVRPEGLYELIAEKRRLGERPPKTDAEIDSEYSEAVWQHLASALYAAFVPAFLFAIGWALLWIGRGFRKT